MVKSPYDIYRKQTPTLNQLTVDYSYEESAAICVSAVADLVRFINVGKTMDSEQVVSVSKMIMEDYGFLTVAHLKLFFSKFKKGHYGKQFDRIDGQVIIQALDQFVSDCMDVAAEINENMHKRAKKTEYNQPFHPDVISAIKSAIGDKYVGECPEPPKEEKRIDVGQRRIRQFNNLYLKYGIGSSIRMVKIGSVVMDINQFLERKLSNNG